MDALNYLPLKTELADKLKTFELPETLGFGQVRSPIMARCMYRDGSWQKPEIVAYESFLMDPFCKSLHYGQQIFEGMKAFKISEQESLVFRLDAHFRRFNASARRMAMAEIDEQIFSLCVRSLTHHLKAHIPSGDGRSLYLRPFMIATDEGLSLARSNSYQFLVLASPSAGYFPEGELIAMIERSNCRAAPGGTGAAKASGNYGASLLASIRARQLGFGQTLWLDALEKRHIEEFSGMNFFAVIEGCLHTPALTDSILAGVTRDSLIQIAKENSIQVFERSIDIDELIAQIESGSCSEIFACGTAAVVAPVAALAESDSKTYRLPCYNGPMTERLREMLTSIQTHKTKQHPEWISKV